MTEAEWERETRPTGMLFAIRDRTSLRKMVLFNLACCHRVWDRLEPADQDAVRLYEAAADDPPAIRCLQARYETEKAAALLLTSYINRSGEDDLAVLLRSRTDLRLRIDMEQGPAIGSLAHAAARLVAADEMANDPAAAQSREELAQTELVRDVFGNPFRPVAVDPAWRTSAVTGLAEAIYAGRAFDRLPVLADALEEAGCASEEVLAHCRGPGPHVRGCWVVDLVLGKA